MGRGYRNLVGRRLGLVLAFLLASAQPLWAQSDAAAEAYARGDYTAAIDAWQVQAAKGSAEAQYNIGVLYDLGQGVERDDALAVRWYRQAAIRGLAAAQFNLALKLMRGEGIATDNIRAYMLFDLAADTDNAAKAKRDQLGAAMAPGEVAQASRLARIARDGDSKTVIREAMTGILPEDEYSPAQKALLESQLTKPVQKALTELGYDPGPVDGAAGPATRTAIRAFQSDNELKVDGQITQKLLDQLYKAFEEKSKKQGFLHGQGRMWQVKIPDTRPSYIFGTMHSNDPRILKLPAPIWEAYRGSSAVALELDFNGGQKRARETMMAYAQSMLLSNGRTLDRIVGPDLFTDALAALRPYGVTKEGLRRLKPWAVYEMLMKPSRAATVQNDGEAVLDLMLAQEAELRAKPLYGLETIAEQLAIFAGMPEKEQVELLESAIAYASEEGMDMEKMTRLYLAGDIGGIFRLSYEPMRRLGPGFAATIVKRLLDDRNEVMVARMDGLLKQGNAFVAVGAAHLPGDAGVLHLLQNKGYEVSRAY